MAIGGLGKIGPNAQKLAMEENKHESENATTQNQIMVERIAKEAPQESNHATLSAVRMIALMDFF